MAAPDLNKIAEDVVRRARAGDQNAMGLIAETRESSLHPEGERARQMVAAILSYCEKNPVSKDEPAFPDEIGFGAEAEEGLGKLKTIVEQNRKAPTLSHDKGCIRETMLCLSDFSGEIEDIEAAKVAALILASGPPLITPRLDFMKTLIEDPEAQEVFHHTVIGSLGAVPAHVRAANIPAINAGKVVGRARIMQLVRSHPSAIKLWDTRTHAEIGVDRPHRRHPFHVNIPRHGRTRVGDESEEVSDDDGSSDSDESQDSEPTDGSGSYNDDYADDSSGGGSGGSGGGGGGGADQAPQQSQDQGGGGGGGGSSNNNPAPSFDPIAAQAKEDALRAQQDAAAAASANAAKAMSDASQVKTGTIGKILGALGLGSAPIVDPVPVAPSPAQTTAPIQTAAAPLLMKDLGMLTPSTPTAAPPPIQTAAAPLLMKDLGMLTPSTPTAAPPPIQTAAAPLLMKDLGLLTPSAPTAPPMFTQAPSANLLKDLGLSTLPSQASPQAVAATTHFVAPAAKAVPILMRDLEPSPAPPKPAVIRPPPPPPPRPVIRLATKPVVVKSLLRR